MKAGSPFNHRPDQALGRALRDLLTPADHQAFVADVVATARRQMANTTPVGLWDVLSAWMRPGLAAAAVLVLATLVSIRTTASPQYLTIDDALSEGVPTGDERTMLLAPAPPDVDVVLVVGYEN